MKIRLLAVGDAERTTQVTLTLPATLGRGRQATMLVPHPLVSRQHCRLYESEGVVMVRDLGSLNGTYVGSRRVEEAEIPSGELLTVATLSFRVVYAHLADGTVGDGDDANPFWGDETTQGPSSVGGGDPAVEAVQGSVDERPASSPPIATPPARNPSAAPERDTEAQLGTSGNHRTQPLSHPDAPPGFTLRDESDS